MSSSDKVELEKRLASLIGFDDVSELLDHAISFSTENELLEYMSSLLGQSGDNLQRFCSDIGRFKKGEPISSNESVSSQKDNLSSSEKSGSSRGEIDYSLGSSRSRNSSRNSLQQRQQPSRQLKGGKASKREQLMQRKGKKDATAKSKPSSKSPPPPSFSSRVQQKPSSSNKPTSMPQPKVNENVNSVASKPKDVSSSAKVAKKSPPTPPPVEIKPLTKGKAEIVCGCYGTRHEPLLNCLNCGYILCKREGFGFCPHCGYEVRADSVHREAVADRKRYVYSTFISFSSKFLI